MRYTPPVFIPGYVLPAPRRWAQVLTTPGAPRSGGCRNGTIGWCRSPYSMSEASPQAGAKLSKPLSAQPAEPFRTPRGLDHRRPFLWRLQRASHRPHESPPRCAMPWKIDPTSYHSNARRHPFAYALSLHRLHLPTGRNRIFARRALRGKMGLRPADRSFRVIPRIGLVLTEGLYVGPNHHRIRSLLELS